FAHARVGMFLPLLTESKINDGRRMIGWPVTVWTSAKRKFTYRITAVVRNQRSLPQFPLGAEKLMLQTSEGPHGTPHKLLIVAKRVSVTTVSRAEAVPTPHPVVCGP